MWGAIGRGFAKVFTFFIKNPQALEGVVTVVEAVRKKDQPASPPSRPTMPPRQPEQPSATVLCPAVSEHGHRCINVVSHMGPHVAMLPDGKVADIWS